MNKKYNINTIGLLENSNDRVKEALIQEGLTLLIYILISEPGVIK